MRTKSSSEAKLHQVNFMEKLADGCLQKEMYFTLYFILFIVALLSMFVKFDPEWVRN